MKTEIIEITQLNGSEACYAAAKAYVEMCEHGAAEKTQIAYFWDDQALIIKYRNNIIGLLLYRIVPHQKKIFIAIGWVAYDFRKAGLYTSLYNHLVAIRKKKFPDYKIQGGICAGNKRMEKLVVKQGRKLIGSLYEG